MSNLCVYVLTSDRCAALVGQNHNIGDPIITRRGGIQFRLSTDVAPGDKYSGVGPHHHSDGSRRRAPSRTSRTRRRGRRRGRLLLCGSALLPPHVPFPASSSTPVAFRSGQFPGKPAQITKALAALAPLEVAARTRMDPRRLVALAADVLCGTYTIAKPSPCTRETRRLSWDRVDGVEAVRSHEDAIDATTSSSSSLCSESAPWPRRARP